MHLAKGRFGFSQGKKAENDVFLFWGHVYYFWIITLLAFDFICAAIIKQKYDLIFAKAYIYIFYETVCGKLTLAKRISETTKGTHKNLLF